MGNSFDILDYGFYKPKIVFQVSWDNNFLDHFASKQTKITILMIDQF